VSKQHTVLYYQKESQNTSMICNFYFMMMCPILRSYAFVCMNLVYMWSVLSWVYC